MSTQGGSPRNGGKPEGSDRKTHRHSHTPQSPRIRAARPNGSGALVVGPNSGRNSGKLPSRGHRVVMGGGGPRVTAEHKDGRPNLGVAAAVCSASSGGPVDGDRGGVDADALNAALLAVQADATVVSRPALRRMLSARERRPLREDSNPSSREGGGGKVLVDGSKALVDSSSGRSLKGKGKTPIVPKAEERHRRSMTMDDRWVSRETLDRIFLFFAFTPLWPLFVLLVSP